MQNYRERREERGERREERGERGERREERGERGERREERGERGERREERGEGEREERIIIDLELLLNKIQIQDLLNGNFTISCTHIHIFPPYNPPQYSDKCASLLDHLNIPIAYL